MMEAENREMCFEDVGRARSYKRNTAQEARKGKEMDFL